MLLGLHEGDQIVNKERSFVDGCRGGDQRGNTSGDGRERPRVQRIVTDHILAREHARGDKSIENTINHRGQDGKPHVPKALVEDQPAQSAIVAVKHLLILVDKHVFQIEHADLLDAVLVDHNIRVIVHLTAFLGTEAHIAKVFSAIDKVDDRRGHGNRNDTHRRQRDRRGNDGNVADKADYIADHTEGRRQDRDRTVARLAIGVLQPLIKLGQIVGTDVDVLCLLHDAELDAPNHLLTRNTRHCVLYTTDDAVGDAVYKEKDQKIHDIRG